MSVWQRTCCKIAYSGCHEILRKLMYIYMYIYIYIYIYILLRGSHLNHGEMEQDGELRGRGEPEGEPGVGNAREVPLTRPDLRKERPLEG